MCESVIDLKIMIHQDKSVKTIKVSENASVSNIKRVLESQYGIKRCEILFCGHRMDDNSYLEAYDIGPQTTLHVVTVENNPPVFDRKENPKDKEWGRACYLTGIWSHRQNSRFFSILGAQSNYEESLISRRPQFYVYCKSPCCKVAPGKLRVRCSTCKKDSIILHRDPSGWKDVLHSGQILGNCRSGNCHDSICDAEFIFRCALCGNTEPAIPLTNVISNVNNYECLSCMDTENRVVSFPCHDEHIMCLSCFEQYVRSNLRERRLVLENTVGYSIPCPEGCRGSYLNDTHIFHILGIDEYQTYQAFAAEECLIKNMKGMICPNPKCGSGLYPDVALDFDENTEITCTSCGHRFCFSCREAFHGSSRCGTEFSTNPGGSAIVRDYFATIRTIEEISKKCPKCKVPTERNGGCMHMTCKMCQYEWCWNCGTEWNRSCQADHWFEL